MTANNPQAFPRPIHDEYDNINGHIHPENGMTLRDYFAGQALIMHRINDGDNWNPETLAKFSYECADAMLLKREKSK